MYNVTDPIPAGIASSGDPAYAGGYSHRPIPAGIALITFVPFARIMIQTQTQLGLLPRGTRLMPVSIATAQSQLGLLRVWTRLMPVCTATDQSQLGLLSSLL